MGNKWLNEAEAQRWFVLHNAWQIKKQKIQRSQKQTANYTVCDVMVFLQYLAQPTQEYYFLWSAQAEIDIAAPKRKKNPTEYLLQQTFM